MNAQLKKIVILCDHRFQGKDYVEPEQQGFAGATQMGVECTERLRQIAEIVQDIAVASNLDSSDAEKQIKAMVYRFLGWRLPKPWNPDNGISYQRPNYAHTPAEHDWPTGTNLFDAQQAEAMVRHMLNR